MLVKAFLASSAVLKVILADFLDLWVSLSLKTLMEVMVPNYLNSFHKSSSVMVSWS